MARSRTPAAPSLADFATARSSHLTACQVCDLPGDVVTQINAAMEPNSGISCPAVVDWLGALGHKMSRSVIVRHVRNCLDTVTR